MKLIIVFVEYVVNKKKGAVLQQAVEVVFKKAAMTETVFRRIVEIVVKKVEVTINFWNFWKQKQNKKTRRESFEW